MLNDQDIKKLTAVLASKKDIEDIKADLNRHEEWIKQIAEKVGLKLITD